MRCTLRRGRPNTPKSGLSVEYRIRKSSVPNTPEIKPSNHHHHHRNIINNTISNDADIVVALQQRQHNNQTPLQHQNYHHHQQQQPIKHANLVQSNSSNSVSSSSLNTAMVIQPDGLDDPDEMGADKLSLIKVDSTQTLGGVGGQMCCDEQNDELLDIAFNGDEEEDDLSGGGDGGESDESSATARCTSLLTASSKQLSVSLTNLPFTTTAGAQTTAINASEPNLISKELFAQNVRLIF